MRSFSYTCFSGFLCILQLVQAKTRDTGYLSEASEWNAADTGSSPALSLSSDASDLNVYTLVTALLDAVCLRVRDRTGWLGVSLLWDG